MYLLLGWLELRKARHSLATARMLAKMQAGRHVTPYWHKRRVGIFKTKGKYGIIVFWGYHKTREAAKKERRVWWRSKKDWKVVKILESYTRTGKR